MERDQLFDLRRKIDSIDRKILRLLEDRLKIAKEIMNVKIKRGLKITDKKREKEIIENLKKTTKNGILKKYILQIYKIIFKMSKTQRLNRGK
jgi:chorismate mutase